MEQRNRRNDNGTAAVFAALFAGVSAIVVMGGALFFLSEDSKSEPQAAATQSESQCEEDDIACLADEAGVSEQVYLAQICEALGGSDCGQSVSSQTTTNVAGGQAASNQSGAEQPDQSETDEPETDGDEDSDDEDAEPEADPEEPEDGEDDDDILVIDPALLWCFLDSDGDGLLNCAEADHGTDPNLFDTDGDGLGDGMEIGYSNPTDFDSDDDGLSDGGEVTHGTDPWSSDTDGDGWNDGSEVFWGTDPLDFDDEPLDFDPWI